MSLHTLAHASIPAWTLTLLFALPAYGYNPPVDRAGPLQARLLGPSEITRIDQPFAVTVELTNDGDNALQGTLQLAVIDQWSVTPRPAVPFSLPARGKLHKAFEVVPDAGTYNAHYPVHLLATCTVNQQQYTAHPILIVEAKHAWSPRRAVAVDWQPQELAPHAAFALWQAPVHRTIVNVFGQQPIVRPPGTLGSEPGSRADVSRTQQTLGAEARAAIAMHPPWSAGQVGSVLQEFPLVLPSGQNVQLQFANGMSTEGQSDGVTFRVRVAAQDDSELLGRVVFERHVDAKQWVAANVDLTAFAGSGVRLQLEADPGPARNTGWDRCFWAEPTLIVGTPNSASPFPPESTDNSMALGEVGDNNAPCSLRIWPGPRGLLDAVIGLQQGNRTLYARGFEVTVLGARLDQPSCPLQLLKVLREPTDQGMQWRHRFTGPDGPFDLVGWIGTQHQALQVRFQLENAPATRPWFQPRIEEVALGAWSQGVKRLYAGAGNVLVDPGAYQLSFDGHRLSTSCVGYEFADSLSLLEAVDTPPLRLDVQPDRTHASLHVPGEQTRTYLPATSVWRAVAAWRANNALRPSAGVPRVAGRFVFDIWGGDYGPTSQQLATAYRYGLTHSMVVWHNWQRWGYDYRLPEIYPPNPRYGSQQQLKQMIDSATAAGVLFALHDNYIDYYPDAEGFSYRDKIAFRPDGSPVRAWLNEGRGAQSYRYRSDRIKPILQANLRTIAQHLSPTAYFIDVWSSAPPYEYWTADGEYFSAQSTRATWGQCFAWIRDLLGHDAPQISESGHDQLIGWLDGAQTNHLRVGKPLPGRYQWSVWNWDCSDAERVPWFDAAHHDRFVLHGAGYESRYVAGLNTAEHGIYSDDYLTTEMLTGHPAMVSRAFGRDVVRKYWLTHATARALALRTIDDVEFVGEDIHRQCVRWSGGATVWINRGQNDWALDDRTTLPQYGFLAHVPSEGGPVRAAIERRNGLIVERSESPSWCYFNARSTGGELWPIGVSVTQVRQTENGQVQLELNWKTAAAIPRGWTPFFHFLDRDGEIAFQATYRPDQRLYEAGTELAGTAHCALPAGSQTAATYALCFGIYDPSSGQRLALAGPDIGDRRIRLGTLTPTVAGQQVTGVAWAPYQDSTEPSQLRYNAKGQTVDFGMVITSSGCRLTPDSKTLVVTPLPSSIPETFAVQIDWSQLPWELPRPTTAVAVDAEGNTLGQTALEWEGRRVTLRCEGNAFAYRLE